MLKDILAQAAFTAAIDRLTKAAKKKSLDGSDVATIFDAVLYKHFPDMLELERPIIGIGPSPVEPKK